MIMKKKITAASIRLLLLLFFFQNNYENENNSSIDKVGPFAGLSETCAPSLSSTMQVGKL